MNEKFDNVENVVEIEECEVDYTEMHSNIQDYKFVNGDFVGKEDKPLSCEVFCVQPCEYIYLQEETW